MLFNHSRTGSLPESRRKKQTAIGLSLSTAKSVPEMVHHDKHCIVSVVDGVGPASGVAADAGRQTLQVAMTASGPAGCTLSKQE
jgi:hypothetical protein